MFSNFNTKYCEKYAFIELQSQILLILISVIQFHAKHTCKIYFLLNIIQAILNMRYTGAPYFNTFF